MKGDVFPANKATSTCKEDCFHKFMLLRTFVVLTVSIL